MRHGSDRFFAFPLDTERLPIDPPRFLRNSVVLLFFERFKVVVNGRIRMREKGLLTVSEALAKLTALEKEGRYKHSIVEDARRKLEAAA